MRFCFSTETRWLYREVRPFLRWHLASFFCFSIASALSLFAPLVLKWLIDSVLPERRAGLLIAAMGLIFVCHQGRGLFTSGGNYLTVLAAQRLALNLRCRLLQQLNRLSPVHHERNPVGSSTYPLREPVDEIAYFGSDLVPSLLRLLVAATLTFGTMIILNAHLTLTVSPIVPIFLLARRRYGKQFESYSEQLQLDQVRWSNFLHEHLSSIIPLQLLRKERRREREAFSLLATKARTFDKLFKAGLSFSFLTSFTTAASMAAVIGYGSWSVFRGEMTVGALVAFYSYLAQLFEPLNGIADTYVRMRKISASIRQVEGLFSLKPEITNCPESICFPREGPWPIEVSELTFAYPQNRGPLSIANLTIASGEMLALIGENGAGKSTFAKLLARLYDVRSGSILIAGHDIREFSIDSLREHVFYASSQPAIFDATIIGNLRIGKTTASVSELHNALEIVGLESWVASLDFGLRQPVGPNGVQLSRGQAQALGLARSILLTPKVLILDEATSSISAQAEQRILRRLRYWLPRSTIIVVSHRLTTISVVDRVVSLRDGRLIQGGGCQPVYNDRARTVESFNIVTPSDCP